MKYALIFALAATALLAGDIATAPVSTVPKMVEEVALNYASSTNAIKVAILMDGEEGKKLESIGGTFATQGFLVALIYSDFPDEHSDVVTSSVRPVLFIVSSNSPKGRVHLAKAESKRGKRSVKMGKAGMFGYSGIGAPDPDWAVEFSYEEMKPGIWKIVPKKDLEPGEYGLLLPIAPTSLGSTAAGEFYGFRVAKK